MDVNFLEKYLQNHPDSIMFARLADAYLGIKRVDAAIQLCEDGIKKHPYYATGHFILAKGYMANSLFEQAEKEFKRVLLFDPKYLGAHKLYGDLMREIGWENTYQMSYKKIMQFDPMEDVAKKVVGDAKEGTDEPESTKDLSEFSLASSERVSPQPKSLDEQEHHWEQGSEWGGQSDWPDAPAPKDQKKTSHPDETGLDAFKEQAFSQEPDFQVDEDPFGDKRAPQETGKSGFDFDAISPMPVTEDEEDLVFGDEISVEIEPEPKVKPSGPETTPRFESPPKVTEVDEDDLDDKKAEEFSYILEDIFKDEIVEEKPAAKSAQEHISKEDAKSALDREADDFMRNFQDKGKSSADIHPAEEFHFDANKPNEDDFPDFSKPPEEGYDFIPPKSAPLKPPQPSPAFHNLSKDDDIESEDEPSKAPAFSAKKKSDKIVTPTLGEIYAAQGQYAKAIDVFEGLLKKHPDNESYSKKIAMLKKKLEEAGNA